MNSYRTTSLLALALFSAMPGASASGFDILACSSTEKIALTPTDPLNCEWQNGPIDATLAQLYMDGWRLIEAEFYNGNQPVVYLERAIAPLPSAAPSPDSDPDSLNAEESEKGEVPEDNS